MGSDDAVTAAGPDHRYLGDFRLTPLSPVPEHFTESLIRQNAGEVVDPAVTLGLPDDRDHLVRGELAGRNACLQPGRILHVLELDLRNFDRHRCPASFSLLQHPLVPFAAIDHRQRRTTASSPQFVAQPRGACRIDIELRWHGLKEHYAILIVRCAKRHLALDHVPVHELRLPLERISPAAAPGRHHAYELTLAHLLPVNQPAELARRAFYIHRHAEPPARFASVEPITTHAQPIR